MKVYVFRKLPDWRNMQNKIEAAIGQKVEMINSFAKFAPGDIYDNYMFNDVKERIGVILPTYSTAAAAVVTAAKMRTGRWPLIVEVDRDGQFEAISFPRGDEDTTSQTVWPEDPQKPTEKDIQRMAEQLRESGPIGANNVPVPPVTHWDDTLASSPHPNKYSRVIAGDTLVKLPESARRGEVWYYTDRAYFGKFAYVEHEFFLYVADRYRNVEARNKARAWAEACRRAGGFTSLDFSKGELVSYWPVEVQYWLSGEPTEVVAICHDGEKRVVLVDPQDRARIAAMNLPLAKDAVIDNYDYGAALNDD